MGDRANFVVVRESGEHELYLSRSGAVGLDLDLLAGPTAALAMVEGLPMTDWWLDDVFCQGAGLIDLGQKVVLLFAWEGPSTELRHRAAMLELLREAWAGWEVRWVYDGNADLQAYLGLGPELVRDRGRAICPGPPLEPDNAELAEPEPMVAVVTVGSNQCFVVADVGDHPIQEGAALLDRLADAPAHRVCRVAAQAGVHVNPERRRVGWWTLRATPEAYEMRERWPGWTVDFWQDRWEEHARVAADRFQPPTVEPELAREAVCTAAERHRLRAGRSARLQ